jgi:hypothetical protein
MSDFMQWVTHGIKRGRFEMSSRTALYVLVPVIVLTLVASLYLMLIGRTAARGRHIEELRVELFRLQRENEQLEVEIAEEGSVSPLLGRAIELGFTSAERVEFLPPAVEDP